MKTRLLLSMATLALAAAATAEEPQATYRLSTDLRVTDAAGDVLASGHEQRIVSHTTLFEDPAGNRIVKLSSQPVEGPTAGAADQSGSPVPTEHLLALDREGRLLTTLTDDPDGQGGAGAIPATSGSRERHLEIAWPGPDGTTFPAHLRLRPGAKGGAGPERWRTDRITLEGEQRGADQETLCLSGRGRLVLCETDREVVALDLVVRCQIRSHLGQVQATAEARIGLRLAGSRFQDVPEWCLRAPAHTDILALMMRLALTGAPIATQSSPAEKVAGAAKAVAGTISTAASLIGRGLYHLGALGFEALYMIGGGSSSSRAPDPDAAQRGVLEGLKAERIAAIQMLAGRDAKTGNKDFVDILLFAATSDHEPEVRTAAVKALGRLEAQEKEAVIQRIAREDQSPAVQQAADDVLREWHGRGILKKLKDATRD